jgi:manganese-dependent inorganic pyrophosphatase
MYIFGHKIPDSDSVIGAISLTYLQNKLGNQSIASRQGDINPETKFILDKFDLEEPIYKKNYANENIYLVDFSDIAQAPDDINQAIIKGIVDHHKLGDITTSTPLEMWVRPVGCSNTIIKQMFDYYDIQIPKNIAGAMMCAILSDTVIFKSPTCTKEDTKVVKELAKIAQIENFKAVGMEMFRVKSALDGVAPKDLIKRDFKAFDMHGKKVGIGQLEVVDGSVFDNIKTNLLNSMKELKQEDGFDEVLLLLTDIMKEGSEILAVGDYRQVVEKAFNITLQDNTLWLDGCLSRKKQIIPFLEPAFEVIS